MARLANKVRASAGVGLAGTSVQSPGEGDDEIEVAGGGDNEADVELSEIV